MKLLTGKWFAGIRLANDLFVGLGRPSPELRGQVDRSRKHRGI